VKITQLKSFILSTKKLQEDKSKLKDVVKREKEKEIIFCAHTGHPEVGVYEKLLEETIRKTVDKMPQRKKPAQPGLSRNPSLNEGEEKAECDSSVKLENIPIMSKKQMGYMRLKIVSRFLLSVLELALA